MSLPEEMLRAAADLIDENYDGNTSKIINLVEDVVGEIELAKLKTDGSESVEAQA